MDRQIAGSGRFMPSPKTLPSRRDQHKSKTRQAIRDAALDLFASQGYDATTTEEIALQAGVSTRTFFRYFPTKESALFFGNLRWAQSVTAEYTNQSDSLSELDAMTESFVTAAAGLARSRKYLILYERAVASSPTLRGRAQDYQRDDVVTMAHALATRRGLAQPDERCMLLGTIALLTYRRALERWLAGPASADLNEAITDEFKLLGDLFDEG
jgi:AcrR family transcriptional regulator